MERYTGQPADLRAAASRNPGSRPLLLAVLLIVSSAPQHLDACTHASCPRPHNEIAMGSYVFPGDPTPTDPEPFRLTGFGLGHTDEEILFCGPDDPNPPLSATEVEWVDFRFYAMLPGAGIVKATLNRDHRSFVGLEALTSDGLFPASFTNNVFLTLEPLAMPGLRYENQEVLQVFAPATPVAPPDSSVVSHLQGEAIFEITAGRGTPRAPERIIVTEGVQTFIDPVNLKLSRVASRESAHVFRVDNPLDQDITAVFFSYVANTDPALTEDLDGVLRVPAGASAEFVVDYDGVPNDGNPTVWVDVMVLDPIDVEGHDRLTFALGSREGARPEASHSPRPGEPVG